MLDRKRGSFFVSWILHNDAIPQKFESWRDRPHWWSGNGGVGAMAMPQRDDTIEAIKRLDALLEYAVMLGDEEEAERLRAELRKLTDEV